MTITRTLSLVAALLLAVPTHAATTQGQGITVEGVCNRRTVPDRGAITVTADVLDKNVREAVTQATAAYERVRDAVKKLALPDLDLETSEYSVQEDKQWENNRMVSKGFRARMGLRVTSSNIQKLGEVITIASRENIRDVGALSTFLSPEKLKQEQMACLEEAAQHARAKADKLATALGSKIGALVSLTEIRPEAESPMPMRMSMKRADMAAEAAAPMIEAGRQDIVTTVYVTFSLR